MAKNYLKSSLENATFNIIIQILFRCVTFVLNAFVLRHVSQAVIGVMNVRLLLLESTLLFLSREAFRRACLSKSGEHRSWAQVVNLLWITVPLCQLLCLVFGYVWLNVLTPPDVGITAHYRIGVWAICASCVVEMACEPVYLAAQAFLFVRLKVALETVHIIVRTAVFTALLLRDPTQAVLAFSAAQLAAVAAYAAGYYGYFHAYMRGRPADRDFPFDSLKDFLPSRVQGQPLLDAGLSRLTWSFFKQGVLKQVLTEGERYVMTLFSVLSFRDQGVYDVVNNLGSMAARFLFRPVEESAYFYFAQMVGRDAPLRDQNQSHMTESAHVLRQLLKCISSVGLLILVFGQSYSRLLLYLYGGARLLTGPGPTLMRAHCLSVLLLAVNGTTECYAFATMSTAQLDKYNYLMAILSVMFLALSWGFTSVLGGVGFILANCCNMAARIAHSIWFIRRQFEGTPYQPLKGLIPGPCFLVALVLSAVITHASESHLFETSKFFHLCVGGVCFVVVLAVWAMEERELTELAVRRWRQKAAPKQD